MKYILVIFLLLTGCEDRKLTCIDGLLYEVGDDVLHPVYGWAVQRTCLPLKDTTND